MKSGRSGPKPLGTLGTDGPGGIAGNGRGSGEIRGNAPGGHSAGFPISQSEI